MTEETKTAPSETNQEQPKQSPKPSNARKSDTHGSNSEKPQRKIRRERKPKEAKEFEESILQIDRVTRVVKGGRRLRFRVSVIIGDQKGRVGFGIGKSSEVMIGIQKAVAAAKKDIIHVPIFEGTLPHQQKSTFKSSEVLLFPAPEGKGIIAGGAVRKILELAGVKDVLSKVHGSRNKLNVAHATIKALQKLTNQAPSPKKEKNNSEEKPEKKEENEQKEKDKKERSSKTKSSKK